MLVKCPWGCCVAGVVCSVHFSGVVTCASATLLLRSLQSNAFIHLDIQ